MKFVLKVTFLRFSCFWDGKKIMTKVWDSPTRIYHWVQACLFTALCVTGFVGEGPHATLGIALSVLLIWRLIWGFVGSQTSRFRHFIASPSSVVKYLSGKHKHDGVGHNPAGGLMVLVMLSLLLFQCFIGLSQAGYFDEYISEDSWLYDIDLLANLHLYGAYLLIGLVGLHLMAIVVYTLRGQPLIKAMVTGRRAVSNASGVFFRSTARAGVLLVSIGSAFTLFFT